MWAFLVPVLNVSSSTSNTGWNSSLRKTSFLSKTVPPSKSCRSTRFASVHKVQALNSGRSPRDEPFWGNDDDDDNARDYFDQIRRQYNPPQRNNDGQQRQGQPLSRGQGLGKNQGQGQGQGQGPPQGQGRSQPQGRPQPRSQQQPSPEKQQNINSNNPGNNMNDAGSDDEDRVTTINVESSSTASQIKILKIKIAQLEKALLQSEIRNEQLLRDFDQYRKRTAEERITIARKNTASVVQLILPVLDGFERARTSYENALNIRNTSNSTNNNKIETTIPNDEWFEGLQNLLTLENLLINALRKVEVETINALGEEFDPLYHSAIDTIDSTYPEGKVAQQYQLGYKLSDIIIRPAMVAVSSGVAPSPTDTLVNPQHSLQQEDALKQTKSDHTQPSPSIEKENIDKPQVEIQIDDDANVQLQTQENEVKISSQESKTSSSLEVDISKLMSQIEKLKAEIIDDEALRQKTNEQLGALKSEIGAEFQKVYQNAAKVDEIQRILQMVIEELGANRKKYQSLETAHSELQTDFEYFRKQVIQALINLSSKPQRPQNEQSIRYVDPTTGTSYQRPPMSDYGPRETIRDQDSPFGYSAGSEGGKPRRYRSGGDIYPINPWGQFF